MYILTINISSSLSGGSSSSNGGSGGGMNSPSQGMTETEIWSYIVQLCSALRCIHSSGLAARTMEPTKILLFGKGRLRVNCVGVMDILALPTIDQQNLQNYIQHWQVRHIYLLCLDIMIYCLVLNVCKNASIHLKHPTSQRK